MKELWYAIKNHKTYKRHDGDDDHLIFCIGSWVSLLVGIISYIVTKDFDRLNGLIAFSLFLSWAGRYTQIGGHKSAIDKYFKKLIVTAIRLEQAKGRFTHVDENEIAQEIMDNEEKYDTFRIYNADIIGTPDFYRAVRKAAEELYGTSEEI